MAKRVFQGLVLFFAVYAFVFVPLGKKTALEHVHAIAGTPAARQAASEVKGGVTRLVQRLRSDAQQSTEDSDEVLEEEESLVEPAPELDLGVTPPATFKPSRDERVAPRSQGLESGSARPR
jgi:hypothetical protein